MQSRFISTLALALLFVLFGAEQPVSAEETLNPITLRTRRARIGVAGTPIPATVSDRVNPVYLKLFFTVGELKDVGSISIVDRTLRKVLHSFPGELIEKGTHGQPDSRAVILAKNLTFESTTQKPKRLLSVIVKNKSGRVLRRTSYSFQPQAHPAESLTAETNFQIFFEIAQINYEDACAPAAQSRLRRMEAEEPILLGDLVEETFPSMDRLTAIQEKESLRGYSDGCTATYRTCLMKYEGKGARDLEQRTKAFCEAEVKILAQDFAAGGGD